MKWFKDTDLLLDIEYCIFCGEEFYKEIKEGPQKKTKHHLIPRHLNPKVNIVIPLHQKCHDKVNKVYRQNKIRPLRELKDFANKVLMLSISSAKFTEKVNKLKEQLEKEIKKNEESDKELSQL